MKSSKRQLVFFLLCFTLVISKCFCQTHEIDSLKNALLELPSDTNKVKAYYDIAKLIGAERNYELAHIYVDSGLAIGLKKNFQIGIGYALHGWVFRKSENSDSAIIFYKKSLPYLEENKTKQSVILEGIGASYDAITNYDSALHYFNLAYQKALINKDTTQQLRILTNSGAIFFYQAKYEDASKNYLKALQIGEAIKDSELIATNYINVGNMVGMLGDSKRAIAYYMKAIPIGESTGNYRALGDAYDNMAEEYQKMNLNEMAFSFSSKALEYYLKAELNSEASFCYKNISDYFINKADSFRNVGNKEQIIINYLKADSVLNLGYKSAIQSEDKVPLANIFINLGYINDNMGNNAEAIKNYEAAVSLCKENDLRKELANVYQHLAGLYHKTNNEAKAYFYLNMSIQLRDSIVNLENKTIIAELNTKYETEKKERHISLLQKENEIKSVTALKENQKKNFAYLAVIALLIGGAFIFYLYAKGKKLSNQLSQSLSDLKQTQDKLIQTEKEKEAENIRLRISRDIHDELGSNLTKIALLSDMTATITDKNSSESKDNLQRISTYSRDVNSTLSEIVWAISPKQDTLESLLIYMRAHIHKFFENMGVAYKIDFPEPGVTLSEVEVLNPDLKRNIFLVLKESLNNILKYAHAKYVTIEFKIDGDNFEFRIKDDGTGFDLNETSVIGNGLNNMKYRMQQSGATLKITAAPNQGCEVFACGKLF